MLGKLFSGGKDSEANQAKLKEQWQRGIGYLDGHLINRAIKELSDAMERDPAYIEEGLHLVREYAARGKDESAAHVGLALLKFRPTDKDLCYRLAQSMRKLKSFKNASKLFERTLQLDPSMTDARIGHAACSFRITTDEGVLSSQMNMLQGIKELRRFEFEGERKKILRVPNTPITDEDREREKDLLKLATVDSLEPDALTSIEEVLKGDAGQHINKWQAQFNLGLYYDLVGNVEQALHYLTLACKLAPKEAVAVNNLAVMLMTHKKDYVRGEGLLLMFLQQKPHDRTTVLNLALCYQLQQKPTQSLRYSVYLGELLLRSLGHFTLNFAQKQAVLYIDQRKYREAMPLLEHLVEEIRSVPMFEALAKVYLGVRRELEYVNTMHRMHEAFPANERVITQVQTLVEDYDKKAHKCAASKDLRQAISQMGYAIKLSETLERHQCLAKWYTDIHQKQHAQPHLKRIREIEAMQTDPPASTPKGEQERPGYNKSTPPL